MIVSAKYAFSANKTPCFMKTAFNEAKAIYASKLPSHWKKQTLKHATTNWWSFGAAESQATQKSPQSVLQSSTLRALFHTEFQLTPQTGHELMVPGKAENILTMGRVENPPHLPFVGRNRMRTCRTIELRNRWRWLSKSKMLTLLHLLRHATLS